MVLNVWGEQLLMPFGGGAVRAREGRLTGVRAQQVQGMGAGNLLRYLQEADARAELRCRHPGWEPSAKLWHTNCLENGFSVLCMLCGGIKPELVQCLAALRRADITELLRHDPKTAWLTVRRKKRTRRAHPPPPPPPPPPLHQTPPPSPSTAQPPGATLLHSSKYSAASSDGAGGTAVAETWYNTSNVLPSAEGVRAFERLTEQTALSNATSGNERVRSNFANKGLGSEAGAAMRGP